MKNHTDLLNLLAYNYGFKSYLEIGVQNRKNNFDLIQIENKFGIDPDPQAEAEYQMSSDEFFNHLHGLTLSFVQEEKWDLIFVDGLHHCNQAKRDFDNAIRHLSPGGIILIHDCLPEANDEPVTHVPRDVPRRWLGDVYKFTTFLHQYDGIGFRTAAFDNGCMMVWKTGDDVQIPSTDEWEKWLEKITFDYYLEHHHELMDVIPAAPEIIFSLIR